LCRRFRSPLLKTGVLSLNAVPSALEGAVGGAPKIFHRDDDGFPEAFGRRRLGDQPLEGAYFYYDAVALVAFALEKAPAAPGRSPTYDDLEAALIDAASTQGEARGWDEVETGLERIRDGINVNCSGLTGPMLLDDCDSRRSGVTSSFHVSDGRIVEND
jgi:hypothetical protein